MNENIIACPSCGATLGEDEWELLSEDHVHLMTCEVCHYEFFMAFFECLACGADNVIVSCTRDACFDRTCRTCGHRPESVGDNDEETCL
jgi:hypothetical protein